MCTPPGRRLSTHAVGDRILVVDDDDVSRTLATTALEHLGFEVQTAPNGLDAIAMAKENSPDLILLDVYMQGLSGIETVRELIRDERTRSIPVIMLTASHDSKLISEAFEAGASDYLIKPFEAPELSSRIRSRIDSRRLQDELERHTQLDAVLRTMSHYLLSRQSEELPQGLEKAIHILGESLDGDRAFLCLVPHPGSRRREISIETQITHRHFIEPWVSCFNAIDPQWILARLEQGETVVLDDIESLPDAAAPERAMFQARRTGSVIILPLSVTDELIALWGIETVERRRTWHRLEVSMAEDASRDISAAMERYHIETQLSAARKSYVQLVTHMQQALFLIDLSVWRIAFASPGVHKIFETQSIEAGVPWDHVLEYVHDRDRVRLDHALRNQKAEDFYEEIRILAGETERVEKWLSVKRFDVNDEDETRMAIVMDDVTERKVAEIRLAENRERELETSARIQRTILIEDPRPETSDIDVDALTIPSEQVDGDFYESYSFSNDTFDILIADVMGKGITGAFWGAALKSQYMRVALEHLRRHEHIPSPAELVNEVHRRLTPSLLDLGSFTTMAYCRFDIANRRLEFVDCGHTPIIQLHSRTERCWLVKGWNVPLGFREDEVYVQCSVPFDRGDLFFFCSDGVTEAMDHESTEYGQQRLISTLERHASGGTSSQEIVAAVKEDVLNFISGGDLRDDFTVIAVRCSEELDESFKVFEVVQPAVLAEIPRTRERVAELLAEYFGDRLQERFIHEVLLALTEGMNNITLHGVEEGSSSSLHLEIGLTPTWLYIRITYAGSMFDWTRKPVVDINTYAEHGYGRYVMEQTMDSVTYAHDLRGGMMLTMTRNVPS